jgi:hypothetical protein
LCCKFDSKHSYDFINRVNVTPAAFLFSLTESTNSFAVPALSGTF